MIRKASIMKVFADCHEKYRKRHDELWARSADTPVCRKWWDYMKDIMETNPDHSPVSIELSEVFHLKHGQHVPNGGVPQ
jgi:L-rhamnose mutarotase